MTYNRYLINFIFRTKWSSTTNLWQIHNFSGPTNCFSVYLTWSATKLMNMVRMGRWHKEGRKWRVKWVFPSFRLVTVRGSVKLWIKPFHSSDFAKNTNCYIYYFITLLYIVSKKRNKTESNHLFDVWFLLWFLEHFQH